MNASTASAPQIVVRSIEFGVRPVRLRLPFRFGAVTLEACPQLFVRVAIEVRGRSATEGSFTEGFAAEMMVPKWFDKRPARTQSDNIADLAASCERAAAAYANDSPASAFELFTRHYAELMSTGERTGATALSSAYGQAIVDRAVLDALCRAHGVSFFEAARCNLFGLTDHASISDLRGFDWNRWLASLQPLRRVDARHTIGMLDALDDDSIGGDGLPIGLRAVVNRYGVRRFKIKLGGDPSVDARRLQDVLQVLDAVAPGHRYTLDGNEQYGNVASLADFLQRLRSIAAFAARPDALLYLEQPLSRDVSLDPALRRLDTPTSLLLDEADGRLDSFVEAVEFGWRGVSSKSCKGLYKAIVNRARCTQWNANAAGDSASADQRFFMSAEDLTCQAGIAVQQDLALLALLGLDHTERNGHHYGDGFGVAPIDEAQAFAAAHADLYDNAARRPRLRIVDGSISLDSLFAPGFAHRADPLWHSLQPLSAAVTMV